MESKAYKFTLDRNLKEGIALTPGEDIFSGRDPEVVVDHLNMKVKYTTRNMEKTKNEYNKKMEKAEEKLEKGTRKWRKMRGKLKTFTSLKWEKLTKEYKEKEKNLVKKYNKNKEGEENISRVGENEEEEALVEGILMEDEE